MEFIAIIIVLTSAFIHATWNIVSKVSKGGSVFVWLYMGMSLVFYSPFVLYLMISKQMIITKEQALLIIVTSLIHTLYAVMLQKGYLVGDFSVIYPIARGTAPILVAIVAFFVFNEALNIQLIFGIIFVGISILILTVGWRSLTNRESTIGVLYGLLVGTCIASYTLIDKGAMSILNMHPLIYYYGCLLGQFIILTPTTLIKSKTIIREWKVNKFNSIIVGVLNPLSYMMVLFVMNYLPVSQIAPIRELSIVIGVILGAIFLKESMGNKRIIASVVMVLGVILIATM